MSKFKVSDKVNVIGKNATGTIAYIGNTHFAEGEWFGVILDDPKGRNNGSVGGHRYFKCNRNHGIFVRRCEILALEDSKRQSEARPPRRVNLNYIRDAFKAKSKEKTEKLTSSTQPHPMHGIIKDLEAMVLKRNQELKEMMIWKRDVENKLAAVEDNLIKKEGEAIKLNDTVRKLGQELLDKSNDIDRLQNQLDENEREVEVSQQRVVALEVETTQFTEITEEAIIEREIAEEKYEVLENEVKRLKERCASLEVDLSIAKEEMQLQCIEGIPAVHHVKKLENQNTVMKQALQKVKEMYILQNQRLSKTQQAFDSISIEVSGLREVKISLENAISSYKGEVAELYETIDGMANADDVVFEVAARNLKYEDDIRKLYRNLNESEEHLEVSEQMEDVLFDIRSQCDEEIDLLKAKLRVVVADSRRKAEVIEELKGYLRHYKSLTRELKSENQELGRKIRCLTDENRRLVSESENLKLKLDRRDQKGLREAMELQQLAIDSSVGLERTRYLSLFLPDFFDSREEYELIEIRIFLLKIMKKIEAIAGLFKECLCSETIVVNEDQIDSVAINARFVMAAYELLYLLRVYHDTFHSHTAIILNCRVHYDFWRRKHDEICELMACVCSGRINSSCVRYLQKFIDFLSQTLGPEAFQDEWRLECFSNAIQTACSCIATHCTFISYQDDTHFEIKENVSYIKTLALKLRKLAMFKIVSEGDEIVLKRSLNARDLDPTPLKASFGIENEDVEIYSKKVKVRSWDKVISSQTAETETFVRSFKTGDAFSADFKTSDTGIGSVSSSSGATDGDTTAFSEGFEVGNSETATRTGAVEAKDENLALSKGSFETTHANTTLFVKRRVSLPSRMQVEIAEISKTVEYVMEHVIKFCNGVEHRHQHCNSLLMLRDKVLKLKNSLELLKALKRALKEDVYPIKTETRATFSALMLYKSQKMKTESENTIVNLRIRLGRAEKELADLSRRLQMTSKQALPEKIPTVDRETQVENTTGVITDNIPIENSLRVELDNMQRTARHLCRENWELKMAVFRKHLVDLKPLRTLKKPKYSADTHAICVLQKRLNAAAVELRAVVLPRVVNIAGRSACRKEYFEYLAKRKMVAMHVEDTLWSVQREAHRMRSRQKGIWSNVNPSK